MRRTGWRRKPWAVEEALRLRDLAHSVGCAYLFKQWGGPTPKTGGRWLGGRTFDEYPAVEGALA